jgi:hypothetical protein
LTEQGQTLDADEELPQPDVSGHHRTVPAGPAARV